MSKAQAPPPAYVDDRYPVKPKAQQQVDPYTQAAHDTSESVGAFRDLWDVVGLPQPKQTKTGNWFRRNIGDNSGWIVDGLQSTEPSTNFGGPQPGTPEYDEEYRRAYEAGELVPWAAKPKLRPASAPYNPYGRSDAEIRSTPVDMSWLGVSNNQYRPPVSAVPASSNAVVPFEAPPLYSAPHSAAQPKVGMPDVEALKRMFDGFYGMKLPQVPQQAKAMYPVSSQDPRFTYPNAPFYSGSKSSSSYFPPPAYPDTAREVRVANRSSLREGLEASRQPPEPPRRPSSMSASPYSDGGSMVADAYASMYGNVPRYVSNKFVGPLLPHQRRRKAKRKSTKKKKTTRKRSVPGLAVYKPMNLIAGRISGRGDYSVSNTSTSNVRKNSVINMGTQIPAFGDMSFATIVRHREFIQDITASGFTTFTNLAFALNPGMQETFPWLAQIAINYDQYQFIGVVFEFRTTSSDTATTLAMGSVIMATDYDSAEANYGNKQQMENSQYCTSAKPSHSFMHAIECDPGCTSTPIKYVRGAAPPAGTDIRQYDHGKFQIATVGLPVASGNLGELWVTYEVALYKPQLQNQGFQFASHFGVTGGGFATGTPFTNATVAPKVGSNISVVLNGALDRLEFAAGLPVGPYMVQIIWVGGPTVNAVGMSATLSAGLTALSNLAGGVGSQTSGPAVGETASVFTHVLSFNVLALTTTVTTITYSATGTIPAIPSFFEVFVYKLPDLLLT